MEATQKPGFPLLKKGETLYEIRAYNHHTGHRRERVWHYKTQTYTPYIKDVYTVGKWKIHSAGKKVVRLMDEEGRLKTTAIHPEWVNRESHRVRHSSTLEEALQWVEILRAGDPHKTDEFEILYNNMYH